MILFDVQQLPDRSTMKDAEENKSLRLSFSIRLFRKIRTILFSFSSSPLPLSLSLSRPFVTAILSSLDT